MLKNQKLILCFSLIISLFFSFQTLATEHGFGRDDEEESYTASHSRRDHSLKSVTSTTVAEQDPEKSKKDAIETVLSPTVQYLGDIPEPAAKALAAVGTGAGSVLVTQSIPASTMESLFQLGALNNVTQDGATPLLTASASGGIPMLVGIMAATDGVLEVLKTEAPEITAAKLITNQRETSRLERWTHSWPTTITQFAFWGTLMFCYYLNLEYRVDGWGNSHFGEVFSTWGLIMGVAILFVVYAVINRATKNSNNNPYLFNKTPQERKDQAELLEPGEKTTLLIQDKGLTPEVRKVAQAFNIVPKEIKVSGNVQSDEESSLLGSQRRAQDAREDLSSVTVYADQHDEDERNKHRYEIVVEKMDKAQRTLSHFQEYWQWGASSAAYYIAPILQIPSVVIKPMCTYAFFDQFVKYCGGSPELAMGFGIGATVLLSTHLGFSTLKEIPLTYREVKQLFLLYRSRSNVGSDSSGIKYVGGAVLDRAAPLVARVAAFLTLPVALKTFLVNEVLIKTYGITNVPLQNAIIAAFFIGTVWPATAQTFDTYVTRMKNWLEMGAPVTWPWCCTCSFKLLPCVDSDGVKATLFALQNRIGDHSTELGSFGPEFTKLALRAIRQPSTSQLLISTNDSM